MISLTKSWHFEFPKRSPTILSELLQYLNIQKKQVLEKISAEIVYFNQNAPNKFSDSNKIKVKKYEKANQNNDISINHY